MVEAVNKLLVTTCTPVRSIAPLVGVESIKVGPTIIVTTTTEISVHGEPKGIIAGRISNGNGPIGMISNILLEIPLNSLADISTDAYDRMVEPKYPYIWWTCFGRPNVIDDLVSGEE